MHDRSDFVTNQPMKRLVRLFGSFTFRLVLLYTLLFGASVGGLFYFVFWATSGFAERQMEVAINAEITSLGESYGSGGLSSLILAVNRRANPNVNRDGIYLLVDPVGTPLAGNLRSWPQSIETDDLWIDFSIDDLRGAEPASADIRARQLLDPQTNIRLLVGRDVREARDFRQLLLDSLNVGLAATLALGILSGFIFSRTIMGRIESITRTCRRIMSGDLAQRVPVRRRSDEMGELALSINAMLDQIERLMKGLQQVSESVAHDLRTPLTRLRSRLESAQRRSTDPAEQRLIEDALADADSLLATFASLLRVARAEAGSQTSFVDVDLHAIAEDVADLYEPLAEDKGVSFITSFEQGLIARGDPNLIAQVLANLIDNAVKYTGKGSVTVVLTRREDSPVFIVADTGLGIPDAFKEKVLERLFRMEGSRTSPGSGLGLSLVAAVAKSHSIDFKLEDNTPGLRATLQFLPTTTTVKGEDVKMAEKQPGVDTEIISAASSSAAA
ncbi:MAG TPA: two-component sensor histidine kinase [Rhodospirillaceae bacterium]|nr:two-component sensor histidine kinase [Candidatus Neomarinimicrobiota bacterium]HCX14581.1 two-component sensor histidine kinase [Rhodospirillaceae bacterium]